MVACVYGTAHNVMDAEGTYCMIESSEMIKLSSHI